MGLYIDQLRDGKRLPTKGKASFLILNANGTIAPNTLSGYPEFQENLVCIVDAGGHDAARYVKDEIDYKICTHVDGREKTWVIVPDVDKIAV